MRWMFLIFAAIIMGCANTGSHQQSSSKSLSSQLQTISGEFFQDLAKEGTIARARYAVFIPEYSINKRNYLNFRETLENALRRSSEQSNLVYHASADKIFFLSQHRAPGWNSPDNSDASILANQFFTGTKAGWTSFHAYWSQANRLLIGDANWIQSLPDSIRADLSSPVEYVLRVDVNLENSPSFTEHIHKIQYDLVQVGSEKILLSRNYRVVTTYELP